MTARRIEHLVLVACCGRKRPRHAPAAELYQSALFKMSRTWAERHGSAWVILSAKHGVVRPAVILAPYDVTLAKVGARGRRDWSMRVADQLATFKASRMTVLAGQKYCGWCGHFPNVSLPLKGLGIGRQLAWLKRENSAG